MRSDVSEGSGILQLEGFSLSVGGHALLSSIDLVIPALGITSLVGPSGGGKSLLLRSLARANRDAHMLESGRMLFGGRPLSYENRPVVVHTRPPNVAASVRDFLNRCLSLREPALAAAQDSASHEEILTRYGCSDLIKRLNDPLSALKPAQFRRLSLVGRAAQGARLLLLDDCTDGLRDASVRRLLNLMQRVAQDTALLALFRQREHAVLLAAPVILIAQGCIRARGELPALLADPEQTAAISYFETGLCPAPAQAAFESGPAPEDSKQWPDIGSNSSFEPIGELAPLPVAEATTPASTAAHDAPPLVQPIAPPSGFVWLEEARLAVCPQPGADTLAQELAAIQAQGVSSLVTLGPEALPPAALAEAGLGSLHWPATERKAPSTEQFTEWAAEIAALLERGETLVVLGLPSPNLAGLLLAGWWILQGAAVANALQRLQLLGRAYAQTGEQEWFLYKLEAAHKRSLSLPPAPALPPTIAPEHRARH